MKNVGNLCLKNYCLKIDLLNWWKKCDSPYEKVHERNRPKIESIILEDGRHQCPKCEKNFPFKHRLVLHYEAVHEKLKPFKCGICENDFACKRNLQLHMSAIHKGNPVNKRQVFIQTVKNFSTLLTSFESSQ